MQKKISFEVNKQKINGTLVYPEIIKANSPGILLIHGWQSNEKGYIPRAQALANLGYICLTFNLRGHGNSEGEINKLSRCDHLDDAIAAYDFLISQKEVDKNKIGVIGSSYGGYMASLLASKRKIISLVLRAPAIYTDSTYKSPYKKININDLINFRQQKLAKENNSALKSLSQYTRDLLLIESEKDEVIPRQTIENYLKSVSPQANFQHQVIKGANHDLGKRTKNTKWLNEFIRILEDWFKTRI